MIKSIIDTLVIIPMFGNEKFTDKCISLTRKNSGHPIDILVVDDGSPTAYTNPDVTVLRIDENSGFTNAINQGILWAASRYKFIHLLNNDTEPEPNFLIELINHLNLTPSTGIVSSVRIHPKRTGANKYELFGCDLIRGFQLFSDEVSIPTTPVKCVHFPFCSVLLRSKMIQEIGLLDKRFYNHSSDTDYCIRAIFNGWNVELVPSSRVLHYLSVTTTSNKKLIKEDQQVMLNKLFGYDYALLMKDFPLDSKQRTWGKLDAEIIKI